MDTQDMFLLEQAGNPGSDYFKELKALLVTEAGADSPATVMRSSERKWKLRVPFRGDASQMDAVSRRYPNVDFSSKGVRVNGLAFKVTVLLAIHDSLMLASRAKRFTRSACFSSLADELAYIIGDASDSPFDLFSNGGMYDAFRQCSYETAFMDHTSKAVPVDRWLNLCYGRGVKVVEGCFLYHPGAERGWDVVFGWNGLSALHNGTEVNLGPVDSPKDRLTYSLGEYRTFIDPSCWIGDSKKYLYEIFDQSDGVFRYRAVYVGNMDPEKFFFNVPMCSDPDNMLITVNSKFLRNSFVPDGQYFQSIQGIGKRDHAIEVRRNVVESCVNYLLTLSQGSDIVNAAIRHVTSRNYIDLVEGTKLVRINALSYSDALTVALVCAILAYQLRYSLTFESADIIKQAIQVSSHTVDSNSGLFGQVLFYITNRVKQGFYTKLAAPVKDLMTKLTASDHIPGIMFDVYSEKSYSMGSVYSATDELRPVIPFLDDLPGSNADDPFSNYIGENAKTSAPELDVVKPPGRSAVALLSELAPHRPRPLSDPVEALQEVYDAVLPGNSVVDIPNVSQQRRVNDLNINTAFVGTVKPNQDVVVNEYLFQHPPLRTAAIPQTTTSLGDLMIASSKRNWNKPDIQIVSDVYDMSERLVSEFIDNAMVPHAKEVLRSKEENPTVFNLVDYCDWLATRSERFKDSLMSSCPNNVLALNMEKYHTILKARIKQKQTTGAQQELPSGQVIVHHDPSTNALFSSVFRQAFNTFDALLKPEYKSAGRISDMELSEWLTSMAPYINSCRMMEIDSSKYDKSQGLLAQCIEAVMMRRLGIHPSITDEWKEGYVGNVASRNLGLAFIIAFQRKSGAADTMLGNIIYNYVSAGRSVGYPNIQFMVGKGDDNVIGLVPGADVTGVTQKMASIFNIDAKVIESRVVTFSSGYIVPISHEQILFCPDPVKRMEMLGEITTMGSSGGRLSDSELRERFTSFGDMIATYKYHGVPRLLAECVRKRTGAVEADIELAVDALITLSEDFEAFKAAVPH